MNENRPSDLEVYRLLDHVSNSLHVREIEARVKKTFWRVLSKFSAQDLIDAGKHLAETYKPRTQWDHPVLDDWMKALKPQIKTDSRYMPCICCKMPFDQVRMSLECDCSLILCYRCFSCDTHCTCPEGRMLLGDSPYGGIAAKIENLKEKYGNHRTRSRGYQRASRGETIDGSSADLFGPGSE